MRKNVLVLISLIIVLILAQLSKSLDPYFYQILLFFGINTILAVSLNLINGFTGQFSIGHAGFMAAGGYLSA
ncbi:MAG: ABC transporter permease subunit, partial [Dictyoglomus sp.]